MSRLLTNLLLLQNGYNWIEYISFEHEIEKSKKEYYRSLRNCQAQRPNEDVTEWINFFLNSLINLQSKLELKLEKLGVEAKLSPKEKEVYIYITNNQGVKVGEISRKLDIPISTIKRIVAKLLTNNLIKKYGKGAGTNYGIKIKPMHNK